MRPFLCGLDESADDGNDSQRETYSSMMPLPRLKILRETYLNRQVVDTAVDLVETHRPELIEKLMEEHWQPIAGRRFHQKGRQWLQLRISRCRCS
jgi:hypothetical protein